MTDVASRLHVTDVADSVSGHRIDRLYDAPVSAEQLESENGPLVVIGSRNALEEPTTEEMDHMVYTIGGAYV